MTFEDETHPGGEEGDNIVKTKLATGEMNDIFYYNSGSLLQALSPDRSIEPLTGDPALDTVSDGFLPAVTFGDEVYGVPGRPRVRRRDPLQQGRLSPTSVSRCR